MTLTTWEKIGFFFSAADSANLSERWRSQNSDFTKLNCRDFTVPLLKHTKKVQFLHKAFTTFLKIHWLVPPVRMQLYTPQKRTLFLFYLRGRGNWIPFLELVAQVSVLGF